MAKPEWGVKRICHACGTRYYDLQRSPIICPSCGVEFDPEAFLKSRRSRPIESDDTKPAKAKAAPAEAAGDDEEEGVDVAETTGDDEDVIDADLPDTDDDDEPKVKKPDSIDDDTLDDEDFDDESGDDALLEDDGLSDDDVDLPTDNDDDEGRNS